MPRLPIILLLTALVAFLSVPIRSQEDSSVEPSLLPPQTFVVAESAPIGHHIGYIKGQQPQSAAESRYFIVATEPDNAEGAIHIDDRTGEITVGASLDHETQRRYELVVIPIGGGAGIPVSIDVIDENDNEPLFTQNEVRLEISEFVRIGAEFPLPSAIDRDGPPFDVLNYRIVQGNVNNVFKLATKRINNVLYADLVVNGRLDREYRETYDLIVEAIDGGDPPRTGELQVSILILDANDNMPEFNQKFYHATIDSNHPLDKPILEVKAVDKDSAHNGQVAYRLAQPISSVGRLFELSSTGILTRRSISPPLPSGTIEFVVIAFDHGMPPQESSVIVSITVEGSSKLGPSLDILWITDKTEPRLAENTTIGSIVSRINITDYDPTQHGTLELIGCNVLCLRQSQHPSVYLLILCGILDREITPEYHLKFILKQDKQVLLEHPLVLTIDDVNDNAPQWNQSNYHLTLNRTITNPEDPHFDLSAIDADAGNNGRLRYWIEGTDVIGIDEDTGRIHYSIELDCSIGSELRFRVFASDKGNPPLSNHVKVTADIVDSSGKPPQFEKAIYTERIPEDTPIGTCILKVIARSRSCLTTQRIRYSLKSSRSHNDSKLSVDSASGAVCLSKALDYEVERSIQIVIEAIDHLGAIASTIVSIDIDDVNDNLPIFYPQTYNITIREGEDQRDPAEGWRELLVVEATDRDSGIGGTIRYALVSGDPTVFRVNPQTGGLSTRQSLPQGDHHVLISATDGLGQSSLIPASVQISVISETALAPIFSQDKYEFRTSEDILPGISIGQVQATGHAGIRYSISGGDPEHHFTINPETGKITVARYLDADQQDHLLLNVRADLPGGLSNHTQVHIQIDDHNDNAPEFVEGVVEVVVREDTKPQQTIFIVQALDRDRRKNGELTYSLLSSSPPAPIMIQPVTGHLVLTSTLDYERIKEYRIRVKAQDHGVPSKSANITVLLKVSDVNDNSPIFEKSFYEAHVNEHSPTKTSIIQVKANDLDSEENGRIEYRLDETASIFGIDSRSGLVFTKKDLDRESEGEHNLTVHAFDGGLPSRVGLTRVRIRVLDINDHSPTCINQTLTVSADRNDSRRSVGTLMALDPDAEENGTLVYRSQHTHPNFIVKMNGELFLRDVLPSKVKTSEHRLSVIVSDNGKPSRSTVCVYLIRVIEGKSSIELKRPFQSTIRVSKDCVNGCRLVQINATNVAIWQIQNNEHSALFSISSSGVLSISGNLLGNGNPIGVTLVLSDKDGRQLLVSLRIIPYREMRGERMSVSLPLNGRIGSKLIEIGHFNNSFYRLINQTNMIDIDESSGILYLTENPSCHAGEVLDFLIEKGTTTDCEVTPQILSLEIEPSPTRPIFSRNLFTANISEASVPNTIIFSPSLQIHPSGTIFKLLDGDEFFSIDSTNGDLVLINQLNWRETPSLVAVIVAENDGLTSNAAVLFNIEDTNDHSPTIISGTEVLLIHPTHNPLHYVVAIDEDSGDNGRMIYSIISGDIENFMLDPITGALSLHRHVDMDQQLVIQAADNGNPSRFSRQTIHIKLHENTKRWSFFTRPSFQIDLQENQDIGDSIFEFPHTGRERFRLFPEKSPFSIMRESGQMTIIQKPQLDQYELLVFAENEAGESDHTAVRVSIKRKSKLPLKMSSSSCGNTRVRENSAVSHLKRIVASSPNGNITYQIQAGNEGNVFSLESKTGWLSCDRLDREKKREYILIITAQEENKSDTCTVRVSVIDENDNEPTWIESSGGLGEEIRVDDQTKLMDALFTLTAIDVDQDENGRVEYSIVDDRSQLLDIDPISGKIFFARALPVLSQESKVRVRASDCGIGKRLSIEKIITLRDYRTHYEDTPERVQFLRAHYVSSVEEGRNRDTSVISLSTTYSTRHSPITYSIIEGNHDSAFLIDDLGTIRTALELDREIKPYYELSVMAGGLFSGKVTTRVSITVLNVNDNPPSFTMARKRKLSEGTPVGSFVTSVTANDADEGTILEYSIESQLNDQRETNDGHFSIDSRTGSIHLIKPLDREIVAQVTLKIRAWDGKHSAMTELEIEILDENDNSPIFPQKLYETRIPWSTKVGDLVYVLSANDYDVSPVYSKINYSIHDLVHQFKINQSTGAITLQKTLSREEKEYLLSISATDGGSPPNTAYAVIRISIGDQNLLHQPQFELESYNFSVVENMPVNLVIGRFGVIGMDSDPISTRLHFRVLDPEANQSFDIDRFGHLWLRKVVASSRRSFIFMVDVSTGSFSIPSSNSTAQVIVNVIDENDHSPRFQSSEHLKIDFQENMQHDHVLLRLSTIDEDTGENGRVTLKVVAGEAMDSVQIDKSGTLLWKADMNDKPPSGSLVIMASDFGTRSRSSLIEVPFLIEMAKWSSTAPFFVMPQYRRHVREGHSVLGRLGSQAITRIRAVNRVGLDVSPLQYSLKDQEPMFSIDPITGEIHSIEPLDFEKQQVHTMTVSVTDSTGRSAVTPLEIFVLPLDEFSPLFSKSSYTFSIPVDFEAGGEIGEISAIDGDSGVDGIVRYRIEESVDKKKKGIFGIDPSSGLIRLRSKLDMARNRTIETLIVVAESGPLQQSRVSVFIEIGGMTVPGTKSGLRSTLLWGIWMVIGGALVLLILLLILCIYRYKTTAKDAESPRRQIYAVSKGQVAVMAKVSRDSPLNSSRLPPKIPVSSSMSSSNSDNQNIRSIGVSSRDFLSNRSHPDSGIDQDTVSLSSSVNEYLQSLGVNIPSRSGTKHQPLASFGYHRDGDSLIYARMEDLVKREPPRQHNDSAGRSRSPSTFERLSQNLAEIERNQPQRSASSRFVDI